MEPTVEPQADSPTIRGIQVGKPKLAPTQHCGDKPWTTGLLKSPIAGPVRLERLNFSGDGQADLKHHGGPDKAVCVYPAAHYAFWQSELRLNLEPGAFGENLTVAGLTEANVCIGDIWEIGNAKVQVSQPRQPCWKLSRWWGIDDLAVQVQRTGRTGWYLRVLQEGDVEPGLPIKRVERLHPDWTIEAANDLMHRDKKNLTKSKILAHLPELSESWRETFIRRHEKQTAPSSEPRLFGKLH